MSATGAPPPASRAEPVVRGFLFADLRGYTAFVERAGDAAAAELLGRYRRLVREVIAEQAGAEIRTEGDSFYVVFPSPSAAIRAGLELVVRAAADAQDHPDRPIVVGVGIHAGESAETTEGYVGSAVNLAARICSVARPGEVLVSGTVRSLARTSLAVTYTSRGRPTLKGVAEPVELYAVAPVSGASAIPAPTGTAATSTRARAGVIGLGAAVVVLAVVGIAAFGGGGMGGTGGSPSPSAAGSVESGGPSEGAVASARSGSASGVTPLRLGPLDAGTYRTTVFQPELTFTLPEGWEAFDEIANWFVLGPSDDPWRAASELFPFRVGERVTVMRPTVGLSPCAAFRIPLTGVPERSTGVTTVELPRSREGFVSWARSNPTLIVGEPKAGSVGSLDSIRYDVEVSPACGLAATQRVEIFVLSDGPAVPKNYLMQAVVRTAWYLVEVDDQALVIAIESPGDHEAFERRARSILSSLEPAD